MNTVFQSYALFPHMTVEENVAYPAEDGQGAQAEIAAAVVEDMLERGEMKGYEAPARTSSRVASASAWPWLARWCAARRCCCSTSRWARSTCKLREQMQLVLRHLQRETGITFVYVTHDQGEALGMATASP